jgi:hypothetical protein
MGRIWPSLLVGLCAVPLLMGAALLDPTTVLWGDRRSEAIAHLWRLEMVMDGLFRHGPFVTASDQVLFPDGLYADFLDPINLLVYAPLVWVTGSHAVAWNGLFLGWIAIGVGGAIALARRTATDIAWSGPLLVATTVLGAFWVGFDHSGRTEYLPALLLPLHLAWLDDALHTDDRAAPWLAGLTLGAMALGGWYVAVFALLVVAPVTLAWSVGSPTGRTIRTIAIVGLLALVLVSPALGAYLDSAAPTLARRPPIPPSTRVSVPGLASIFHEVRIPWPPVFLRAVDQPCYPGVVALALGIAGAIASPRAQRRRTIGWLALVGWILIWGAGSDVALADAEGNVTHALPGFPRMLERLAPITSAMRGWTRIGCVVGPIVGLALVRGLEAPMARWPRLRLAVPALVLAVTADTLTWPMPFELRARTFDPSAPRDLVEIASALPPGALVLLPHDAPVRGEGSQSLPSMHQHFVLWRRELQRPITDGYLLRMDAWMDRNALVAASAAIAMADVMHRPANAALSSAALPECARADARALAAAGVAAIVLVRNLPGAGAVEAALVRWLGPPLRERPGAVAWETAALSGNSRSDCPTPEQLLAELWAPGSERGP